jgi:hypothetical protein
MVHDDRETRHFAKAARPKLDAMLGIECAVARLREYEGKTR